MKYIKNSSKAGFLLAFSAILFFASCNKNVETIQAPPVVAPSGLALGETMAAIPNDSLYFRMIVKNGLLPLINTKSNIFTLFVPDNNAMRVFINAASGGAIPLGAPDAVFSAFIQNILPATSAVPIVYYNMIPQYITTASVPSTFPNWFYPSNLNPTTGTPGFNPLVRLTTSPSTRNGNWINNVPLTGVNISTVNGIIHTAAAVPLPPSTVLWARIATDPDMTYLAAAIQRADSGVNIATSASLQWALTNFGPNLTVFAPTNAAFQATLIGLIAQGLIAQGVPPPIAIATATALVTGLGPSIFSFAPLFGSLTAQAVKGIAVYHLMGYRAFTNNFPTTATNYPTLLNGGIPAHPGVTLACTFTGLNVTAATIKGVANATAATILLNPTPNPGGTSDQHFVNGTLHKITQVLLPQ